MNNGQRNTFVRRHITDALLSLLSEKPLDKISVRELTERAEVGRASFYRNYTSKEDVLRQESDRLMRSWGNAFEERPEGTYDSFFLSLFDFLREHRAFYTTVCKANLSDIVRDTILATAEITPETPNLMACLKSFWAYGIYGWTIEWIDRGMQESGVELLALFQQMNPQR